MNGVPITDVIDFYDQKIMQFVKYSIIPELLKDTVISRTEYNKLTEILYYSVALDVYSRNKISNVFKLVYQERENISNGVYDFTNMDRALRKVITLADEYTPFMGKIRYSDIAEEYKQKYVPKKGAKRVSDIYMNNAYKALLPVYWGGDLVNFLNGTSHVKTVVKLKEYLDNGGSIRALNTKKSINFKALSRHVDKLKASIIDDSKYIDYFLNSEGQIESRIKKNTRNKYNKIDLTIELINAAEAYRKENTFITLSLAGLYQEHLRRELDNGVWGDIKDLAKYLKEDFLTSVEYKKFIKELRNGAACKYMNEFLMDHDISELNSKDFEKKMLEEAKALSMKRTSPEEYIPDLVETFRKLRTEQQEIEKLANMTPEEEREFMGKDWQAWGIPLGAAAMGIIFGATASFTLIDDFNAALGATNIQFIISSVVGSVAALVRSINLSEKRKCLTIMKDYIT